MVLEIVALVFLVEALTNLLSKSDLFTPVRKYCFESSNVVLNFIHKILDCPYCTSVWVAMFVVVVYELYKNNSLPFILTLFFISIILHRLSNILHFIIDRLDGSHFIGNGTNF